MRKHALLISSVLVAVLVWAGALLPAPLTAARADSAETGTTVAIGLGVAVAVVYGLVCLRDDIENYASADEAIERATAVAEASPVVIDSIVERSTFPADTTADGLMVGWRVRF